MLAYVFALLGLLVAGLIFAQVYPRSATNINYAIVIAAFATLFIFVFGNESGTRLARFISTITASAVLAVSLLLILGIFQPYLAGAILAVVLGGAFAYRNLAAQARPKVYLDDDGNRMR
jgi:hypothetical protein